MKLRNKIIGGFLILIVLFVFSSIYISSNIGKIETNMAELTNEDFTGITVLLEADRDSYQSNVALSQIMKIKDVNKIDKIINKGVNDNLLQVRQRFDKFKKRIETKLDNKSKEFNEFDNYYNLTKKNTEKLIQLIKSNNTQEAQNYYFNVYLKDYESMRDLLDFFTTETYKVIEDKKIEIDDIVSMSHTVFLIISILSVLIAIIFSFAISKAFDNSMNKFKDELLDFFKFLNKETKDISLLDTSKNDEVAIIAQIVNENIEKTKNYIHQDEKFIADVNKIVNLVKNGKLNNKIEAQTNTESLNELKEIFNDMIDAMTNKITDDLNEIEKALIEYKKLNFAYKIPTSKGDMANGLNELSKSVSDMLLLNKTNGLTLQDNALDLLDNVEKLNIVSTQAAASIEETAAALDEITGNMASNSQNVAKMVDFAHNVTQSAHDGEKLASQTTESMEQINLEVNAINEAITVIDQIAFQTNILSLNAAVEAATAGEAGKGFAVVAQEVRNLAARSAEAAKEIKELVENATLKANDGKHIALEMIKGYSHLNDGISNTIELINNVGIVIKEQQTGIEQINNAINSLDKQTQENATVASYTKDIANQTRTIANEIVEDADRKEFDGKNSVQAKKIEIKKEPIIAVKKKVEERTVTKPTVEITKTNKVVTSNTKEEDEWESF